MKEQEQCFLVRHIRRVRGVTVLSRDKTEVSRGGGYYRRICAIARWRSAVGRSLVGATIDRTRCAICRYKLGRRRWLIVDSRPMALYRAALSMTLLFTTFSELLRKISYLRKVTAKSTNLELFNTFILASCWTLSCDFAGKS